MVGNEAFAVVSVSAFVALGFTSAIIQFAIMVYVLGKWGITTIAENGSLFSGPAQFLFLSDTFAMAPGLANAWMISVTPSVAIAAVTIRTSLVRDNAVISKYSSHGHPLQCTNTGLFSYVYFELLSSKWFLWYNVFLAHWGLALLSFFDLNNITNNHYVGVVCFSMGNTLLNLWVVRLDYGVNGKLWHPFYTFDAVMVTISVIALFIFPSAALVGYPDASAAAEWVILGIMVTFHILLPIRGARIVLSKPNFWWNFGLQSNAAAPTHNNIYVIMPIVK
jgi:hypothetical protein